MAVSGGDHPVRRDGLTTGQAHTDGRVALHEDFFDLSPEAQAPTQLV